MRRYLPLINPNKFLNDIADTIQQYYPIGVSHEAPEYEEYPGTKKNKELMQGFHDDTIGFTETWRKLYTEVKNDTDSVMCNTTYGFVPGCSADLILERYEDDALIRVKRLAFAISLLGPYFSVCGVDETFIKETPPVEGFQKSYHAINTITKSPYNEFETDFNYLKNKIESGFTSYQFIPIDICLRHVKGLDIDYSLFDDATVYNALFNNSFCNYITPIFRGDSWYGIPHSNITVNLSAPPKPRE